MATFFGAAFFLGAGFLATFLGAARFAAFTAFFLTTFFAAVFFFAFLAIMVLPCHKRFAHDDEIGKPCSAHRRFIAIEC